MTGMGDRLSSVEVEEMVRVLYLTGYTFDLFRCARLTCSVRGGLTTRHLPGLSRARGGRRLEQLFQNVIMKTYGHIFLFE